jgi:glyoxalase family protein
MAEIRSLHHVTATVDGAQDDLDFFLEVLGLRLVKKTVNFDNPHVYHFYYGDERGTPGTLMTTFPYRDQGVRVGHHGAGQITATAFSVPAGSLAAWSSRLRQAGVAVHEDERFGDELLTLRDPSGLVIELIANRRDGRPPWVASGFSAETAVRGLHGVTLSIREPRPTLALLTEILGYEVVGAAAARTRLAVGEDRPGHFVDVLHTPDAPPAKNGLGTVHHVAMAVDDDDAQLRLRAELVGRGLTVTEVRDRQYFRSIYFREPGGVLYEAATVPPGFTVDEELASLGQGLKLPPWEEPRRAQIETGLARVRPAS